MIRPEAASMDDCSKAVKRLAKLVSTNTGVLPGNSLEVIMEKLKQKLEDERHAMDIENEALKEESRVWQEQQKICEQNRRREALKWWMDRVTPPMAWSAAMPTAGSRDKIAVHESCDSSRVDVTLPTRQSLSATSTSFAIDELSNLNTPNTGSEKQLQTRRKECPTTWHAKQVYSLACRFTFIALIGSSFAQPTPSDSTGDNRIWKGHPVGTITDDLSTVFLLLYPLAILVGTIRAARGFDRRKQDGKAACIMLVMVFIFAAVPGEGGLEEYARTVIGLAYAYLMTTYCKLVAMKNGWRREGYCTFAGALAIMMVVFALSLVPVRTYLAGLAGTSVVLGLSLAIPLAVTVCDVASFMLPRIVVALRTLYGLLNPA